MQLRLVYMSLKTEHCTDMPATTRSTGSRSLKICRYSAKPHIFTGNIEPQFPGGKWVYEAKELKIGYDGSVLLELSLRIRRGQKIAVIGDNGIGKSTFLKTVAGLIPPIKGTSQLGSNLLVGYFDQQSALIDSDKTLRDHFHELFPALLEKDLRKALGM